MNPYADIARRAPRGDTNLLQPTGSVVTSENSWKPIT